MHAMTNLVPAPGVLFAFDEKACAVVHTINGSWHYLTGDRAWAWQAVHVTGTVNSLDEAEVNYVAEFMDYELIINDMEALTNPIFDSGSPSCTVDDVGDVDLSSRRSLRKAISRSWPEALRLGTSTLANTLRTIRYAHEEGFPFVPLEAAKDIQEAVIRHVPWWVPSRHRTSKAVTTVTTVAAHRLGVRMDFSFGMSHQTQEAASWCSTPEGHVGRSKEVLVIGQE